MPLITLSKNQRLLMTTLSLILFLAWILAFPKALTPQSPQELVRYTYTLNTDSAYSVNLLPNDIYDQTSLGENAVYATNLMKDLRVNFMTGYQASHPSTLTCTYDIQARVRGYQTIGGTQTDVFTKDYVIQAPKTVSQENTSSLDVSQDLVIDPASYIEFSANAQRQISSSLNREIQLIFSGTIGTATANGTVSAPFTSVITMPLGNDLFTINKTRPTAVQSTLTEYQPRSLFTKPLFYVWLLLPLTGLLLMALLFLFSRQPSPMEIYTANLKSITRRYGRRMIDLSDIPAAATEQADIRLKNIRSLVRLAAKIRKPLCYKSNSAGLPEDGRIYIIDTHYRYYYQETTRDFSRIVPCKLSKIPSYDASDEEPGNAFDGDLNKELDRKLDSELDKDFDRELNEDFGEDFNEEFPDDSYEELYDEPCDASLKR